MYEHLLKGLYAKHNLRTQAEKENYLQKLQKHVKSLRSSYNSFPVRFDYTNVDVQAAYLLAYYPHYTDLLFIALTSTGEDFLAENIKDILLFGSGPCPEIIGYLRYFLQRLENNQDEVNVTIYDIAVDDWKWSRDLVYKHVVPEFSNGAVVKRSAGHVDISVPFDIEVSSVKTLCVFQNCLNEIQESEHRVLIDNINDIFEQLETGSYLAIVDLHFRQVLALIEDLETVLNENFSCEMIRSVTEGQITHRTHQNNEPNIILNHLLTDRFGETPTGLLPKRNINFIFSLIKKL